MCKALSENVIHTISNEWPAFVRMSASPATFFLLLKNLVMALDGLHNPLHGFRCTSMQSTLQDASVSLRTLITLQAQQNHVWIAATSGVQGYRDVH